MSALTASDAANALHALADGVAPDDVADAYGVPTDALIAFAARHGHPEPGAMRIAARLLLNKQPQRRVATPRPDLSVAHTPPPKKEPVMTEPTTTQHAIVPTPRPLAAVPTEPPLTDLERRADTPAAQRLAEKARTAYDVLLSQVRSDEASAEARAEVQRLEAELAAAQARLRKTTRPGATAKSGAAVVRAWARENGIRVPERGVLPAEVRQAYEKAHGGAA